MVVVEEVQFTAPAATAGAAVISNKNKSNNKSNNKSDSCSSAANNNSSSTMSNEQQQQQQLDYQMAGTKKIGRTLKTALLKAQAADRVIVGLQAAINMLSQTPEGSLFCLMAVPQDAATHMHEVLLEAFCYENDIYVIKVDCPNKLSRILGKNTLESCCLVQKTWARRSSSGTGTDTFSNAAADDDDELLNKSETILVDYCEAYWDAPHSPVIELPPV